MYRPEEIPKLFRELDNRIKRIEDNSIILIPVNDDFEHWPIPMLLTGLLFGEARNQPDVAKIGVAFVVENRVRLGGWYGKNHREVILKKNQFSCFNKKNPNRKKILNPLKYEKLDIWLNCWKIAQGVLEGRFLDPTYRKDLRKRAVNYFDKSLKDNPPSWARRLVFLCQLGDFYFYG